jgi:two-component system OmpR family sensor kinase
VIAGRRTELEVRLPKQSVRALCDRERVMQIMRILLDNALRHTPEGTPVTVIAGRDNGSAELVVADKGPGVAPASHSQVFERFYTADAARGSGLGLAIAKELAERMDGRITLNSRPGRTVFKLALPMAADEPADRSE